LAAAAAAAASPLPWGAIAHQNTVRKLGSGFASL